MNYPIDIETVRDLQSMLDEGISVRYVALNTGLSWFIVNNINTSKSVNDEVRNAIKKFVKDKSYHLTKHRIKSAFKAYRYASDFLLEADGWDMFDIKRIKEKCES